jgi:multidrug efflux pump subunit AcrA (membrane-fusion protein)
MAVLRPITLGGIYGDKIEVTSGAMPGEKVVLTGQLNLVDGAKVSVIK